MLEIIKIALQKDVVVSSFKVAIVVGVILNLINQFQPIVSLHFNEINYFKLILTFCVPYLVSTYASVVTSLRKQ